MKRIFQDYDISTQFTPVNTLKNALVNHKDKQQLSRRSNVVHEICCNQNFACQEAYIGETSKRLQHRHKQHCLSSCNGNDVQKFSSASFRVHIKLTSMM